MGQLFEVRRVRVSLVVLITFVASPCRTSRIAEFARRLPSAGSLYT
jgi:hypothetical protein